MLERANTVSAYATRIIDFVFGNFIGALTDQPDPRAREPGSLAAALAGAAQGVQLVRVHDVAATRQALTIWSAINR